MRDHFDYLKSPCGKLSESNVHSVPSADLPILDPAMIITAKGDAFEWREAVEAHAAPIGFDDAEALTMDCADVPAKILHPSLSVDVTELLKRDLPERRWLLTNLIQERDIAMIHAPRGIGKSWTALSVAAAVASGSSWLRFEASRPATVLYVDGEMPAQDMQVRFREVVAGLSSPLVKPIRLLSADTMQLLGLSEIDLPSLATPEGQKHAEREISAHGVELVIIDSISTLCGTGHNESDPRSWEPMQAWLLSLRRAGVATLLLHHAGKDGNQRGTSKREDVLTQVLNLRRPSDYEPSQGARFELHYSKARAVHGDDAAPIEASLKVEDGAAVWTWQPLEASNKERAFKMFAQGMKPNEVKEELGVSRTSAYDYQKEWKESGGVVATRG